MLAKLALAASFVALSVLGMLSIGQRDGRVLDARYHHLGNDTTKDWPEASPEPEGKRLDIKFDSKANAGEWTLFLEQRSIDKPWRVRLNDVEFALLKPFPDLTTRSYAVPAAAVIAGSNQLSFVPDDPGDDVVIGNVRLVDRSLREMYDTQPVSVVVKNTANGALLPARVTFVDAAGVPVVLYYAEAERTAVREGVVYVSDQQATLELPPGEYTSFATRGCEWSCSKQSLKVKVGTPARVVHSLTRELDTRGFVAVDTHLHTLQFSGHGDASADERQITLAGEGVELAIATDHNHDTDYAPYQKRLGLSAYFTTVVGNEVTTDVGHFNGFPLNPRDPIPEHQLTDYVAIVDGIRARGAKVVILNHPRWPSHEDSPFTNNKLDRDTGEFASQLRLTMDATEMINSCTDEADPLSLFTDWFALLNRGLRIFAVGSSDSHTVGEPVGQGRTYAQSATDDPTRIDVAAVCDAIKFGRTSIGMGMFATITVNESAHMGDTLVLEPDATPLRVELRLQAPSWIVPRKATLFSNGSPVATREVAFKSGERTDARIDFRVEAPNNFDRYLVCVVTGDPPQGAFWPGVNPYTLAATNPVFVDCDGDGYKAPRETAARWLAAAGGSGEALGRQMEQADEAIAVHLLDQLASNLRGAGKDAHEIARQAGELAQRTSTSYEGVLRYLTRL